ncbi:YcbK family protein [Eubacterium maltosivorans]|uniref:Peptidase M15 n=2 Tax=Eubacterium TaxID=1730 RepID=A0A2A5TA05_EUBML|nr:D-Ala-D-Ala carboxypeptidase family metallohydrolase [Eubacterium maltosivorans]QCT70716.1 peptidase M15 [Eubacterium maltosivorans]
MKNIYKTISQRLILSVLLLVSCVFLIGLSLRAEEEPVPTAEQAVGEPEQELPAEPEAPAGVPEDAPPPAEKVPEAETPVLMATAHFAMEEYRCDCAGYCGGWPCEMRPELLEKIEALRCYFGRPVIITSGVRCEARNAEVGGVAWSFHMRGCAADLYCPGVAVGELAGAAKDVGLNVLPYYAHGYIHVEI